MADYPTRIQITDPATGKVLDLSGTLSASSTPPVEPPTEPPTDGITEKLYRPEEFSGDFVAMQQKMLVDQQAAGDGLLRCVVQFERNKRYEYQKNNWLTGVQNYRCEAVGSGANPVLFNANVNAPYDIDRGPLNIGKGANCFTEPGYHGGGGGMSKTTAMALIGNARAGDTLVKLLTASDASRLEPGRWHAVFSYAQQIGGYPPNCRWIDYVKVVSITNDVVNLDRPLAHDHWADYWEDPSDQQSVGKARIGLWDGFYDGIRCTLEGTWKDLDFEGSGTMGHGDTTYIESHIDCLFENCSISNFWPSLSKNVTCVNCSFTGMGNQVAEPDKLCDTLILDGCTTGAGKYLTGGTGFTEIIIKNSKLCCIMVGPRKLTVSDSTIDAMGDAVYCAPCGWPMQGHKVEYSFTGTTFVASSTSWAYWAWNSAPVTPLPLSASAWQGNKLIIRRDFAGYENWLVWLYEGIMLFTGPNLRDPKNYGRVDKIYAPADGSALWCDVTWIKGNKPTSGNLNIPQKGLRKLVWGSGTNISAGGWTDPDFICMTGTPADRPFPQGIT